MIEHRTQNFRVLTSIADIIQHGLPQQLYRPRHLAWQNDEPVIFWQFHMSEKLLIYALEENFAIDQPLYRSLHRTSQRVSVVQCRHRPSAFWLGWSRQQLHFGPKSTVSQLQELGGYLELGWGSEYNRGHPDQCHRARKALAVSRWAGDEERGGCQIWPYFSTTWISS